MSKVSNGEVVFGKFDVAFQKFTSLFIFVTVNVC